MIASQSNTRISLKNILFLTDFSGPSEIALPFAVAMARAFGAKVHALHILLPEPGVYAVPEMTVEALDAQEQVARAQMRQVESKLEGIAYSASMIRDASVWSAVMNFEEKTEPDLIVLGTHGRTGTKKALFGSVAEEIFRRSCIPVLTIGPCVCSAAQQEMRFRNILFATDFTSESLAAMPYALSLAEENESRLILLNVIPDSEHGAGESTAADAATRLHALVPPDAEFWCRPEALVEKGNAAAVILEVANKYGADLIVLGVHHTNRMEAATHLGGSVAHDVVIKASCPVLTVRR